MADTPQCRAELDSDHLLGPRTTARRRGRGWWRRARGHMAGTDSRDRQSNERDHSLGVWLASGQRRAYRSGSANTHKVVAESGDTLSGIMLGRGRFSNSPPVTTATYCRPELV